MDRSYGQFCPVARAAEIVAERWTPIIIRNLLAGCRTFTEIEKGAPGISKTLLSERLRKLERYGIVGSAPSATGRGSVYDLTPAGWELGETLDALGRWGARWLELAPHHLDPGVALWNMARALRPDAAPRRRVVLRFDFGSSFRTMWLLIEGGSAEVCAKHPGGEEEAVVAAEPDWFVRWRAGHESLRNGTAAGVVEVQGRVGVRALERWFGPDRFAHVRPVGARAQASSR